jgi:lipoprotein-anchoring transpeptidase ErfK/SrfK
MKVFAATFLALCATALAQQTPAAIPPTALPTIRSDVPGPAATPAPPAAPPAPIPPVITPDPNGEPPVAKAIPVAVQDVTTQLQIFLDQQLFGPGKIDGAPGEFVTKALKRYQRSRGLPETGVIDENIPLDSVFPVYTHYTIQKTDLKYVGDLPRSPQEQSKRKYLPYTSLLEFLTERYHCSPGFLMKLNKGVNLYRLKPGDEVRVPNVEPFKLEEVPETGPMPELPQYLERVITVHRAEKLLDLYEGERLLCTVPITPGGGGLQTPAGTWKIVGIAAMPTFRWDKSVLMTGKRSKEFHVLPAGPRNPVGVVWAGLSKPGIGIHGTNSPQTIGRAASHGCMRVANWDAIRLCKMITKGMTVVIK